MAEISVLPAWRTKLLLHASKIRQSITSGTALEDAETMSDRSIFDVVSKALGPMAQEAIQIVEAYAIGSATSEMRNAGGNNNASANDIPPEFNARLNIILNGLEPVQEEPANGSGSPRKVIQSDLWQLLYMVRESAEMAYARELDLVELDRRILFLLQNVGPLVPAEISSAVGVDKAQVSRSVKRLLEIKMVEREQLRAPLRLTPKGARQSERLMRLADLRNRELTFGVGDAELKQFFAVIEKLLDQAMTLYEQERKLSQNVEIATLPRPGAAVESESRSGGRLVLDRSRIISPLMTLSAYFSRSGSLTFKRLTELSNFEAWVLNEIGMEAPIEWNVLVDRLDRDHSQAGRTIRSLMERGLIQREGKAGRRHGQFSPTDKGKELYDVIQDASRQRSTFLLAPLTQAERDEFLSTFDQIMRNSVVQLERERTFNELGKA